MKTPLLDKRIIAAKPADARTNRTFTDRVMLTVENTSSRQKTMMGLLQLPKYALALCAIAIMTLLGGSAYAIYKAIWSQPSVVTQDVSTNQLGHKQLTAMLTNCGDQEAEATFEIKSGSILDIAEIHSILQARCELDAIRNWAEENDGTTSTSQPPTPGESHSSSVMVYPTAGKVASINASHLTLAEDTQLPPMPLILSSETQYIANGNYVTQDSIHPGDSILFVQDITTKDTTTKNKYGEYTTSGMPTQHTLTYVIKLNLPSEYYNGQKQSLLQQRTVCMGNLQDSCIQAQSLDIYTTNTSKKSAGTLHAIQGVITLVHDNSIKLQSSSGRNITIATQPSLIADFNQNQSAQYNDIKVAPGNILQINYFAPEDGSQDNIAKDRIVSIQLLLSTSSKTDMLQKY